MTSGGFYLFGRVMAMHGGDKVPGGLFEAQVQLAWKLLAMSLQDQVNSLANILRRGHTGSLRESLQGL